MKASNARWKEKLAGKLPETLAREVDIFDTEVALRKQGKMDERLFAETRLRRGVYGQRYDNGQRHDGQEVQEIAYPFGRSDQGARSRCGTRPGMQRIKIPGGGLNADQLETMARACRGIFRRHRARDHPPGFSAPLHSHRRHADRDAPAGRGQYHHARGLRQFGPQCHGMPVRGRLRRSKHST